MAKESTALSERRFLVVLTVVVLGVIGAVVGIAAAIWDLAHPSSALDPRVQELVDISPLLHVLQAGGAVLVVLAIVTVLLTRRASLK